MDSFYPYRIGFLQLGEDQTRLGKGAATAVLSIERNSVSRYRVLSKGFSFLPYLLPPPFFFFLFLYFLLLLLQKINTHLILNSHLTLATISHFLIKAGVMCIK